MEVNIYTIKNCGYCKQAKEFLDKKGIKYREFDMGKGGDEYLQTMKRMFKQLGLKSYPVTLVKEGQVILQGFVEKEFINTFGGI